MPNIDFEKLYNDAKRTYETLEDESLWFGRGSDEYKNAMQQMEQDVKLWETLVKKKKENPEYVMSDYEIQMANQLLQNQEMLIDTYLENKEQERKELEEKGKTLSQTSEDRIDAMKRTKNVIGRQQDALDDLLSDRMEEQPLPLIADLKKESEDIAKEMDEAEKGVWFGSSEYKDAKKAYQQLNDDWNYMNEKFEGQIPNSGDLQWMKAEIMMAQGKAGDYLLMKGDDLSDEKANKRKSAMGRGISNMDKMVRKIAEWEKANEEKEIKYDPDKALKDADEQLSSMKEANRGFFIGSSEYRAAMNAVEEQMKFWKKIQAKGQDYQPSPDELHELENLNQKAEKAINAYVFNNVREGVRSEREINRMRVMMKGKDHVVKQKQILNNRRKALTAEAEVKSYRDLGNEALDAEMELKDAKRNVHFGSRAYSDATKKYKRSYSKWSDLEGKGKDYIPTVKEIEEMKAEIEAAQKSIEKYLNGKKDKDLDRNPKTKKRVEAMRQANKNLELRKRKLEKLEKKQEGVSAQEEKKKFNERVKNLHSDARDKAGVEKHAARASLAATQKLSQLSQKKEFSALDLKEARRAMAALVMEERLKDLPEEVKKKFRKSTVYADAVKKIANSKEFKAAIPDDKLTPLNCKRFARNPESVKKTAKDFDNKLKKRQAAKKETQKQQEKKKVLENKKELK